jgi:nitronate monooxygenase
MSSRTAHFSRAHAFCQRFGIQAPVLLAPMAGACPPRLSAAVANAGGMGACGAVLMPPAEILDWAGLFRAASNGAFQMNLWVPHPPPARDHAHEAALRDFLGQFGPAVPAAAGDAAPPDFTAQFEAVLDAAPAVASSIMGLFAPELVMRLKQAGIAWWATVTTVAEARAAAAAGADAIVAQGMEAGGHRGSFEADRAETTMVGLFSLLPAVVDAVDVPVVAAGGIADARGAAAALLLGASAVQIGTALLRCTEAEIPAAWATGLARAAPEDTVVTRAFSGRAGRAVATAYTREAAAPGAPPPAPYPVQRGLTRAMRDAAVKAGYLEHMQAWAGQSAMLGRSGPAGDLIRGILVGLGELLG